MSKHLRWKKLPKETGLSRVGAGPRGSILHDGKHPYAWVYPVGGDWRGPVRGWYFVCPADSEVGYKNTCDDPADDEATAKAQAMKFVKARLSKEVPNGD